MEQTLSAPSLADAVVGEHYHLRVPSRLEWIEPTVDYLTNRAVQSGAVREGRAGRLMLALHEALTNSVVHGNLEVSSELRESDDLAYGAALVARAADPRYATRTVDVRASYDGARASWAFTDEGPGFDVESALRRLDEHDPGEERAGGRGLLLMQAFTDEVSFAEGGRRVVLSLYKAAGEDQRAHPRLPVHERVRVAPIDDSGRVDLDSQYDALTRNISHGGITLLQPGPSANKRVLITIPNGESTLSLPAEARHWHRLGPNVVEMGCRFEFPLQPPGAPAEAVTDHPDELLADLVERLARERSADERRGSSRVIYTAGIRVNLPDGRVVAAFARNLSCGGVAFVTTAPLPPGPASVDLPQGGDRPPLRLAARVVRCEPLLPGFYDIGARFLRT
jgi:anti-sigma regulatory factor (Ser/Thr protein kinase)